MKILVVCYSRSGNTEKAGKEIAHKLNADFDKIIDLTYREGIKGWFIGGKDAYFKKETKIKFSKKPENYDLVIIGTPVWAGTMTPAVRTYLSNHKMKHISFFCTYGGSVGNTFIDMEKLSKKPVNVLGLLDRDVKNNKANDKIEDFCLKLKNYG